MPRATPRSGGGFRASPFVRFGHPERMSSYPAFAAFPATTGMTSPVRYTPDAANGGNLLVTLAGTAFSVRVQISNEHSGSTAISPVFNPTGGTQPTPDSLFIPSAGSWETAATLTPADLPLALASPVTYIRLIVDSGSVTGGTIQEDATRGSLPDARVKALGAAAGAAAGTAAGQVAGNAAAASVMLAVGNLTAATFASKKRSDGPQLLGSSRFRPQITGTAVIDNMTVYAISDGILVREFDGPLQAAWAGVLADGVTDDTAALQLAINTAIRLRLPLQLAYGTSITTAELLSSDTAAIVGQPSAVGMFEWMIPLNVPRSEIRRTVRGSAEQAVLRCRGAGTYVGFVQLTASGVTDPDKFGPIKYSDANLSMIPGTAQSSDYGLVFEGTARGSVAYRCEVTQALKWGIVLGQVASGIGSVPEAQSSRAIATDQGNVMRVVECMTATNANGILMNATDSRVIGSYPHHNVGMGLLATAAFPHISGNRSEWNGRQGYVIRAAEFDFTGNLADRNAWSGLFIDSNWRGQVSASNSFSRNGAGGDGTVGRWGFATPGTRSYILTPEEECCHIRLKYMRGVTITGNSYRAGLSDGNDGSMAPARIYYGDNVVDCTAVGNAGEFPYVGGSGGYNAAHPLYVGAVEKLMNFSQKSLRIQPGFNDATEVGYGVDVGPLDTLDIPLPAEFFGSVTVMGGKFGSTVCCVADVIRRTDNAFSQATVRINSGTITPVVTAIPAGIRLTMTAGSQVYLRYRAAQML